MLYDPALKIFLPMAHIFAEFQPNRKIKGRLFTILKTEDT